MLGYAGTLVSRLSRRMPDLWSLLETKGRGDRVREVRDDARTNVPPQKYLSDDRDCDDADLRQLKSQLKALHRRALYSVCACIVVLIVSLAGHELLSR